MEEQGSQTEEQARTCAAFQAMAREYAATRPKYAVVLSDETLSSLERWALVGVEGGEFVMAALCNNLMEAIGRADERNLTHLRYVAMYIYNRLPMGSHGSGQRVREWAKAGGLMGYDRKTQVAAQLEPRLPS